MKKTLIALGVLAALPSLALSAEVSIYGKVDVGLAFVNVDPGVDGQDSWSNLSMQSGQTAGSRVGMTGFEELGNGHKVGFILENGFNVDNGAMGQGGKIFGRQALLYLDGPYGNIKFGKMGALTSGYPSTGLFGGNMSPFAVKLLVTVTCTARKTSFRWTTPSPTPLPRGLVGSSCCSTLWA